MSLTFVVPKEYGYVVVAASSTFFVALWQGILAAGYRKPTGLTVPKAYADSSDLANATPEKKKAMYLYNCAQRAHGNFLELQPSILAAVLISGVQYPTLAASLGAAWSLARVVYAVGFVNPTKTRGEGRMPGFIASTLIAFALYGLSTWSGVRLLL